ncbi:MAG: hypothetical protein ACYCVV_00920 [Acidimicrobiales bacterium]
MTVPFILVRWKTCVALLPNRCSPVFHASEPLSVPFCSIKVPWHDLETAPLALKLMVMAPKEPSCL